MRVLAVGEVLWDVFPEQELLGGAALNFCANLNRFGASARLFSAVGDDERGRRICERMSDLGLVADFVQQTDVSTGVAIVSKDSRGEPSFLIQRPAAYDRVPLNPELLQRIAAFDPEWIYLGTLFHTEAANEATTVALLEAFPAARVFYDMNLRTGHWNIDLVRRFCTLATILKLNEHEVHTLASAEGMDTAALSLESFCEQIARSFDISTICITLGARGCFVYKEGRGSQLPGYAATVRDTVGAGDAFAAAFLHAYHAGSTMAEAAQLANAAGAIVAGRAGATPAWEPAECAALIRQNR